MYDAVISLVVATGLLLGAPGPAPLALAATGGVHGFRRGLPFLAGILAGLAAAIVLGAAGIAAVFEAFPASRGFIQALGGIYVGYLAYKVALAPGVTDDKLLSGAAPGFSAGFILNLLNPKVYAVFLALFSQFLLPMKNEVASLAATGLIAYAVAIGVDVTWLGLGNGLRPVFRHPTRSRIVRVLFGLLMVGAVLFAYFVRKQSG